MLTRAHRTVLAALPAGLAAIAIAACGGSSGSSSSASAASAGPAGSAGTAPTAQFAKYRTCLKQHGVNLPSGGRPGAPGGGGRPPGGGYGTPPGGPGTGRGRPPAGAARQGGGFLGGPGANTAQGRKFQVAAKACAGDLPKGGRSFGGGGRRAGAPFSAATLKTFSACVKRHGYTLPAPNTSGSGSVFPRSIQSNARFQRASRACRSDLRPTGATPPAAG